MKELVSHLSFTWIATTILGISILVQRYEGQESLRFPKTGSLWEPCFNQEQCKRPRFCLDTNLNAFNACSLDIETGLPDLEKPDEVSGCHCLPLAGSAATECKESSECGENEICAQTSTLSVCASCFALDNQNPDNIFNFQPLNENDVSTKCDKNATSNLLLSTPMPTPNPDDFIELLNHDYCNTFFIGMFGECADGHCQSTLFNNTFCNTGSTQCQCQSIINCTSSLDCNYETIYNQGSENEDYLVCAKDLLLSKNTCVSCKALNQFTNLVPIDNDDISNGCINNKTNVERYKNLNSYQFIPNGPNGFTYEQCINDESCQNERICLEPSVDRKCRQVNGCICLYENIEYQKCSNSTECPVGEVCTISKGKESRCFSKAYLPYLDSREYPIIYNNEQNNTKLLNMLPEPNSTELKNTGDICKFDWDCLSDNRRCTHLTENTWGRCAGRHGCFCREYIPTKCNSNDDCDENEYCVRIKDSPTGMRPTCSNIDYLQKEWYELVDDNTDTGLEIGNKLDEISGMSNGSIKEIGSRLSGEPCFTDNDCLNKRCIHLTEPLGECNERNACLCDKSFCDSGKQCDEDEICTITQDQELENGFKLPRCLSKAVLNQHPYIRELSSILITPSPSISPKTVQETQSSSTSTAESSPPDDSGLCIDENALFHLQENELIFNRNSNRASVLCDDNESCATPGHIVIYYGASMMMKNYCQMSGINCHKRVKVVNSPRMNRGIRIRSRTEGLLYSALAAKYEWIMEERVMQALLTVL